MQIAVCGNARQRDFAPAVVRFIEDMRGRGARIVMHPKLMEALLRALPGPAPAADAVWQKGDDLRADLAVCFGGDGAILRTAMWVGPRQIPILGVNTGHLGFLAGATAADLPTLPAAIASGGLEVESRRLLHVVSPKLATWPYALNEVAISKCDSMQIIEAETTLDGRPLATYRADGIIIATPTGSTAYNLSAGGPIIEPGAPVWAISPIAAHSLGMRPLVVSDSHTVSVTARARSETVLVALDGRAVAVPRDTAVVIRNADFSVRLAHLPGRGFPAPLREKLAWGS